MKKWMYLIFPGTMLAIFLVFFLSHSKEAEQREAVRLENVKRQKEEADKKKADDEMRARKDAEERAAKRAEEDAKKEADRLAKLAAQDKEVKDLTDKALAEMAASQKKIDDLEGQLDRLHKQKDQASRETFETAKQVELAKVAKRAAEMEVMRETDVLIRKANESYLVRLPPPPPPPKNG